MIKTIFAVALAVMPAGAAEFSLERTGLEQLRVLPAIEAPAAKNRLSVSEIDNRWIAAIYVAGQRLQRLAANADGIAPHSAPAGYAVSLAILADRTAAAAEDMHYAYLERRWHVIAFEADKLDRTVRDIREWAAAAKAHHNAAALKAADLAATGEDLATALRWLRADSGFKAAAN